MHTSIAGPSLLRYLEISGPVALLPTGDPFSKQPQLVLVVIIYEHPTGESNYDLYMQNTSCKPTYH